MFSSSETRAETSASMFESSEIVNARTRPRDIQAYRCHPESSVQHDLTRKTSEHPKKRLRLHEVVFQSPNLRLRCLSLSQRRHVNSFAGKIGADASKTLFYAIEFRLCGNLSRLRGVMKAKGSLLNG
jgi:hypothetical protein